MDNNANSVDEDSPFGRLFEAIFDGNAARLFVVLRNGDRLPRYLDGTDLDVSTLPGVSLKDVYDHVVAAGRTVGWTPVCVSRLPHVIGMALIGRDANGQAHALHFDIFNAITYRNLVLCSKELLHAESLAVGNVRQLTERGRVLATVAHHMAWNGYLSKQKYRDELGALIADERDGAWLKARLVEAFNESVAGELMDPTQTAKLNEDFERRRRAADNAVFIRSFRESPVNFAKRLLPYAYSQLNAMLNPPGIVGAPGDAFPGDPDMELSLSLACEICPRAFACTRVQSPVGNEQTENGPRYEVILKRLWKRSSIWRTLFPSGFLWFQASRGRIAVVNELPALIRMLRKRANTNWVARPNGVNPLVSENH